MLRQCHSLLLFLRILIELHIKQKKGENQYVDVLASTGQVAISECTGNNYVPIWAVLGSKLAEICEDTGVQVSICECTGIHINIHVIFIFTYSYSQLIYVH